MSWNNIKHTQVTSITATIANSATGGQYVRLQGFTVLTSGTGGGQVEFKDAIGGTVRVVEKVPTATNSWIFVKIPDGGVRFEGGMFVSAAAGVTLGVYWG